MEITLSYSELNKLLNEASFRGAKMALRFAGIDKTIYTRSEIVKTYGETLFDHSRKFVKWQKKGKGKTSPLICQKIEFESFLQKFNIELKPVQND